MVSVKPRGEILAMPTDLVSREENPAFFDLIEPQARILYDEGSTEDRNSA
jgi:hypothetical protein